LSDYHVFTFTEDLEPIACLWDVHCAYYKNCIKIGYVTDFLAKMYEISTIEVAKIAIG
jgi:hypothetical protein